MGFGGHVMSMIKMIRENRNLMPSKSKKAKQSKGYGSTPSAHGDEALVFKTVPEEELKKIKKVIRKKAKSRRIRDLVLFSILGIAVLWISLWILYSFQ